VRYLGLENIESWTGRVIASETVSENAEDELGADTVVNYFESGDVLFGKLRPYLAKAHLAKESGVCTSELLVMRPKPEIDGRFLFYSLLNDGFISLVDASTFGSKMPRADWGFIGNVRVPLPHLSRQRLIADVLDRETARLDALLAAKQRWLEIVTEKHRTAIAHAVSRGINSKSRVRDSNVEWLGKIPTSWTTRRVKYLFDLVLESAPVDHEFELLSVYTDIGVRPRSQLEARGNKATTTEDYWLVRPGDLVVNKLLAWMGAFGVSEYEGVTSPAYDILRPKAGVDSKFYHHLFRCGICFSEFRRRSTGIMDMRLRLYFDKFGDMRVPFPPLEEQRAVVAHIATETAKLDALRHATERTIQFLEERRRALIRAAVTGKILFNSHENPKS
jgi:type I restriction enzyme S subunit